MKGQNKAREQQEEPERLVFLVKLELTLEKESSLGHG